MPVGVVPRGRAHAVGGRPVFLVVRVRPWRKRQDSVVSMMWARWVRRSTTALASLGSGNTLVHSPNGRLVAEDQAAAFVAFGEDLEDELGSAVGQGEVAQLLEDDELGAA